MFLEHFALIISVLCLGPQFCFQMISLTTSNVGKVEWGGGCFVAVMSDSWDTLGYSPSGFSVHGISQVRTLEWVVISSSIE